MPDIIKVNKFGEEVTLENHWDQPITVWTDDELREALRLVGWVEEREFMEIYNELQDREKRRGLFEPPMYV